MIKFAQQLVNGVGRAGAYGRRRRRQVAVQGSACGAPDGAPVAADTGQCAGRGRRPTSHSTQPASRPWLADALARFAGSGRSTESSRSRTARHARCVRHGRWLRPPMDYEQPIPVRVRARYDAARDPFARTGSPALPDGLNARSAAALARIAVSAALLGDGATLLPWAQYWAWGLSGVAATEVTSLGCHTDLWSPQQQRAVPLANVVDGRVAGAAAAQAAAASARQCRMGAARAVAARRTVVHCGLHDSNAALLAGRGFPRVRRSAKSRCFRPAPGSSRCAAGSRRVRGCIARESRLPAQRGYPWRAGSVGSLHGRTGDRDAAGDGHPRHRRA